MASTVAPANPMAALPAAIRSKLQSGDLKGACAQLERHVAATPDDINALHVLGELHFNLGDAAKAETALLRVLKVAPRYVPALHALGLLRLRGGRPADALPVLQTAVAASPNDHKLKTLMVHAASAAGQAPEDSLTSLEDLARTTPNDPNVLNDLGNALRKLGRISEAETRYREALAASPGHGVASINLAVLLSGEGRTPEAVALLQDALRIAPTEKLRLALAGTLITDHRPGDALMALSEALSAEKPSTETLATAARAQVMRGRVAEACAFADRALDQDPKCVLALKARAAAYDILGNAQGRLDDLLAVAKINPTVDALRAAAQAANSSDKIDLAIHLAVRAILFETNGDAIAAQAPLAIRNTADLPAKFYQALPGLDGKMNEDRLGAISLLCLVCANMGCFAPLQRLRPYLEHTTDHVRFVHYAFASNYDPSLTTESIAAIYAHRHAQENAAAPESLAAPALATAEKSVLRIGFMSPDFRRHAVMKFLGPLIDNLDRDAFRVHAYAELRSGDDRTRTTLDVVDAWTLTTMRRDAQVAETIRRDGIDILVDVAGRTAGNRLGVFTHRAAPVQATWLGYGSSTGAAGADYFLGDGIMAPVGTDHLFTETLVRLPDSFTSFAGAPDAPALDALTDPPMLRKGHVTFGVPSRLVRLNDTLLQTWARLLGLLPDARLIIDSTALKAPFAQETMTARAARCGLPMDRVTITRGPSYWDFFAGVDIVLDCFPHSSGTTTVESLWMGVPVVTIADRPPVGRIGASLIAAAGHPEWIAWNRDEYLRKAVALASDPARLKQLRRTLRPALQTSPLCDGARFTRNMEEAFRRMWHAADAGTRKPLWIV